MARLKLLAACQERLSSPLDMARRHIVEADAKLVLQRKIVMERVAKGQHEAVAMGMRVLRTMEANLAVMRDHLRVEEQRR